MTAPVAAHALALIGNTPSSGSGGRAGRRGARSSPRCEFMNPGGSAKDRAGAFFIVEDAEEKGSFPPGGTDSGGDGSGRTGIGLALVGMAKGYKVVIVIPETQSQEKKDTLRALGAELIEVAPHPAIQPGPLCAHLPAASRRRRRTRVWSNQFDNTANRLAHIRTTAPEIWAQTGDGSTASPARPARAARWRARGSVSRSFADDVVIALTRSARRFALRILCPWRTQGRGFVRCRGHRAEPHHRQPGERADRHAISHLGCGGLAQVHALLREGLCVGLSSGINVAGAMALARDIGPGHRIVTILADSGHALSLHALQPGMASRHRGWRCRNGWNARGPRVISAGPHARRMIGHDGRDEIIAVIVAGLAAAAISGMPAVAQAASSSSGLSCSARKGSASPWSTSNREARAPSSISATASCLRHAALSAPR